MENQDAPAEGRRQDEVPAAPVKRKGGRQPGHDFRTRRKPHTLSIRQTTHGVTIFTTGQVAKLFGVAPRTVTKWTDSDKFPGSYTIPGSLDRRIPLGGIIKFIEDHPPRPPGLLEELWRIESGLENPHTLAASLFLPAGWLPDVDSTDMFDVGLRLHARVIKILVFGCEYGLANAAEACKKVIAIRPDVMTGIVLGDDRKKTDVPPDLFSAVFMQADGPGPVKDWIVSAYQIKVTQEYRR